jgi:hypothetical protein
MAPTSRTPLIVRMAEWLGRRLARYLTQPVRGFVPLTTADPKAFLQALRPADVVLVEGDTRVATAIKYLTQSTWSHSLLYVGPIPGRNEPSGEPHVLVEADVEHGLLSSPASKYAAAHTRICRPVGLSANEVQAVTDFVVDRIGLAYDLKNIIDLMRYLLPTPPVPTRLRRRMIALGAGSPTRAICSTLIAQAFQSINYPILPPIEALEGAVAQTGAASVKTQGAREVAHIRHHSLYTPRDFDISSYFAVVKPSIAAQWARHARQIDRDWVHQRSGELQGEAVSTYDLVDDQVSECESASRVYPVQLNYFRRPSRR